MDTPLGKPTIYNSNYDKNLLVSIPRSTGREAIGLSGDRIFNGVDFWNCYEVSWLDLKGKPNVYILELQVSSYSEFIIESKSLKLYLNSFNAMRYDSASDVERILKEDLSQCANYDVHVKLKKLHEFNNNNIKQFEGICLDELEITVSDYSVNKYLLKLENDHSKVEEVLFSDLLKSNCLITNQPDWASICIHYAGAKIDHSSLLKYIISFREHNEFHEQCVEHIFYDIMQQCKPDKLTVFAKYTRRGGIDINPLRTTENVSQFNYNFRDIRQ